MRSEKDCSLNAPPLFVRPRLLIDSWGITPRHLCFIRSRFIRATNSGDEMFPYALFDLVYTGWRNSASGSVQDEINQCSSNVFQIGSDYLPLRNYLKCLGKLLPIYLYYFFLARKRARYDISIIVFDIASLAANADSVWI